MDAGDGQPLPAVLKLDYVRSKAELLAKGTRFVWIHVYRCDDGWNAASMHIIESPHLTSVTLFPSTYIHRYLCLPTKILQPFALVAVIHIPHTLRTILNT